jgi:hypothetical protein
MADTHLHVVQRQIRAALVGQRGEGPDRLSDSALEHCIRIAMDLWRIERSSTIPERDKPELLRGLIEGLSRSLRSGDGQS